MQRPRSKRSLRFCFFSGLDKRGDTCRAPVIGIRSERGGLFRPRSVDAAPRGILTGGRPPGNAVGHRRRGDPIGLSPRWSWWRAGWRLAPISNRNVFHVATHTPRPSWVISPGPEPSPGHIATINLCNAAEEVVPRPSARIGLVAQPAGIVARRPRRRRGGRCAGARPPRVRGCRAAGLSPIGVAGQRT
jgi:hypothetical protein